MPGRACALPSARRRDDGAARDRAARRRRRGRRRGCAATGTWHYWSMSVDQQHAQSEPSASGELEREVARRRTFAIISHPDAGKTTLTEKLLLYAGAIELAGAVRGRKARRHATSDWMALEQERGISITAAAL